ncbi:unnamed protein product [Phytophthora lilii]|uniref:Unnamed protein product n=1 Tax=Phytophthora lilii TaxID=2077276 RepID=A0A9W6WSI2_9STRA|nr:unnamed protein product [Phytophthora lilii]
MKKTRTCCCCRGTVCFPDTLQRLIVRSIRFFVVLGQKERPASDHDVNVSFALFWTGAEDTFVKHAGGILSPPRGLDAMSFTGPLTLSQNVYLKDYVLDSVLTKSKHKKPKRTTVVELEVPGFGWLSVTAVDLDGTAASQKTLSQGKISVHTCRGLSVVPRAPLFPYELSDSKTQSNSPARAHTRPITPPKFATNMGGWSFPSPFAKFARRASKSSAASGSNNASASSSPLKTSSFKLYANMVSQPSRAVAWALKVKGADYEFVNVKFGGELIKSDEFKAWNPNALVPVIRDGDFALFEGYVSANVDEFLHWHHTNTRLFTLQILRPAASKAAGKATPSDLAFLENADALIEKEMTLLETFLDKDYVAHTDAPTVADYAAYCEIDQLEMMGYEFSKYPKVTAWIERMKVLLIPESAVQAPSPSPNMTLKLYANLISQPSRSVAWVLKVKGVDHELVPVNPGSDFFKSDEFKAINPNRLVPAIKDDDFVLTEGMAILQYLGAVRLDRPQGPLNAAMPKDLAALEGKDALIEKKFSLLETFLVNDFIAHTDFPPSPTTRPTARSTSLSSWATTSPSTPRSPPGSRA